MSTFYPFGIPSTSSFSISASNANKIINPNYTAPLALQAIAGPPGPQGVDATTCPDGFINVFSPPGEYTPVPSNPNVANRNEYILCAGIPSPTPTRTVTPSITPSVTMTATPSVTPSKTPFPTRTPSQTPAASVTPTPTVTPSRTMPTTIQLTIGGNISGGFPDFWVVKSNVPVPVDVIFGSSIPELKGYANTEAGETACINGEPPSGTSDSFPGATLSQGTTSVQADGPGASACMWSRVTSAALIDTNDGNGSQPRVTGTTWTDLNNYTWSLTITDQTCNQNYQC